MLRELVKTGKLYGYNLGVFDGKGVVIADSEEEAEKKILEAYRKHGYGEDYDFCDIYIEKVTTEPFADFPDVLEICE